MLFKILSMIIGAGIVLWIITFIMRLIRPSYSSTEKRIKAKWTTVFKAKVEYTFYKVQGRYYRTMRKVIYLSAAQEREYNRYIDRLNLRWNNEPLDARIIKLNQYTYLGFFILIGFFTLLFNRYIGVVLIIMSPIGYRLPIIDMKEKIEKLDGIISREFSAFYSVVYYQFRKQNKMLTSVVREYLPNASPEMAFELKLFLQNLTRGEEYALVELRKRLPLKYIIRFCDVMKVRVAGVENISQMTYLKEAMHEEERHRIRRALDKRKKQAVALQTAVYLLLVQFIIVYWYLQLNNVNVVLNK